MTWQDRECIKQCLNGHPDEYRNLVTRYKSSLSSFLTGRLGSRERAEEAAQETFVRAYFSLKKLKKPESFFAWLLGIAGHVAREEQRTQARHNPLPPGQDVENPGAPEPGRHFVLERAVANLPEPYRETVLLRYYGGLNCTEVAERKGVAVSTVTKNLSRAYAKLRETMKEHGQALNRPEVQS